MQRFIVAAIDIANCKRRGSRPEHSLRRNQEHCLWGALRVVSIPAIAEEVTLEVYLQVWRQASRYRQGRGTVLTWLMLLARTRALDRLRSERTHNGHSWEYFSDGFDMADSVPDPEHVVQAKQLESRMSAILRRLPEEQRDAIKLSFYEGLSHVAIAERLGLPLGTVKSRIRSGIDRCRREVG
jgi:RNA polymerase sigma-70 factor, ECF subfamily